MFKGSSRNRKTFGTCKVTREIEDENICKLLSDRF